MLNSIWAWNGRAIVSLLCLNVAFASFLWENVMVKVDEGSLVFGNATIAKSGRVYVTVDEAGVGTLDVTCILPPNTIPSNGPYFRLDYKQIYNGNRSEVTVLNKTTIRLFMTFSSPQPRSYLQCKPNGRSVDLYVNRGLEAANQYANCSIRLPSVNASSLNASVSLVCDLTIIFGIDGSHFEYNVTVGTSSSDEGMVLSETAQTMPIRLIYEKLTLANVLNSSVLFIRTSLDEQYSGRNKMLYTEVAIVDILKPPLDLLSWDPLDNGTGIRVFLNPSYLNQKCGMWQYHADIRLEYANNSLNDSTNWHMRCTLCNSPCQTILNGLRPATTYPVTLWQQVVMSGDQHDENQQNIGQLPAHHLAVSTAELAPLTAPEILAEVTKCSNQTTTCDEFPETALCFVVKVSWQPFPTESLRGHLIGYTVIVNRGNTSDQAQAYNLPPNVMHAPDICWDGSNHLNVSVAGKTEKGLSPFRVWDSSLHSTTWQFGYTSESQSTSDHNQGISVPVVASILTAAGVIPIALTVVCIKFAQYRKAWKSNRLRIPRIAPSISSVIGKGQEQDTRSSYVKLSAVSSEDLNKLAPSTSDYAEIPNRLKPSNIHGVRRSLSYTHFLNHQAFHMDTSESSDATNLMEGGRHLLANRSQGTRSAEQLIHYLTNVSDYSFEACTTKCISPQSLRKLMVASKNESDAAYLSSDWFETSNESSAVFPSYPRDEGYFQSLSLLDRMCGPHTVTSSHRPASIRSNESAACSVNSIHILGSTSSGHLTDHDSTIESQCREKIQDSANFLTYSSGDYIRSSVLSYEHAKRDAVTAFTKLSPESDYIMAI